MTFIKNVQIVGYLMIIENYLTWDSGVEVIVLRNPFPLGIYTEIFTDHMISSGIYLKKSGCGAGVGGGVNETRLARVDNC